MCVHMVVCVCVSVEVCIHVCVCVHAHTCVVVHIMGAISWKLVWYEVGWRLLKLLKAIQE